MKLGSVLSLPGQTGAHIDLNEQPCPERTFTVVTVGSGGVYDDVVRCRRCHRELNVYGDSILDRLAERLLDVPDEDKAIGGIKLSYRYSHLSANGQRDAPPKWFYDCGKASEAFTGITREAAIASWRPQDVNDRLMLVVVELYRKGAADWERIERKEYKP